MRKSLAVVLIFVCAAVRIAADGTAQITSEAAPPGNDLGDFDNDGISDILWRNTTNGDAAIWFMNGGSVTPSGISWAHGERILDAAISP